LNKLREQISSRAGIGKAARTRLVMKRTYSLSERTSFAENWKISRSI